jgi:hypothetical protein
MKAPTRQTSSLSRERGIQEHQDDTQAGPDFSSAPGAFTREAHQLVRVGAKLEVPDGTPPDRFEGSYMVTVDYL